MNKNVFCNRKNGATIGGEFLPHPTVTEILSKQLMRAADKMRARRMRRAQQ